MSKLVYSKALERIVWREANAKIKNIKRSGYGFRDMKYSFLKIKAVLPGDGIDPGNFLTDDMGILAGKVQTCRVTGR